LLGTTQNRLATGKKVNSALDNPTNFFTASALSSRASDLSAILDAMSNGINTLKAADNGLTAITTAVETMKATVSQARQDSSFKSTSYTVDATAIGTASAKNLTFSGGAVGTTPVNIALNTVAVAATPATISGTGAVDYTANPDLSALDGETVSINGVVAYTFTNAAAGQAAALEAGIEALDGGSTYAVTLTAAGIDISRADGTNFTVTTSNAATATSIGIASGTASVDGVPAVAASVETVDELVTAINTNLSLIGKVKASNDGGKLNIQNLSTEDLTVVGAASTTINGGTGAPNTVTVGGNTVRKNLITQFNDLRTQLDKLAEDASFNGVNLLRGDTLKLVFNETNTSSISIVAQNANGINSSVLNIGAADATEFSSNTNLDLRLDALGTALTSLRSQASAFGSNLSIVQNRTEFTKAMINTLQTGADSLVLADSNEEAANLLALQTRQQLSTTALSLASQADQAVLRLF
jgi:flagellin-like hook-associated protein FlgL